MQEKNLSYEETVTRHVQHVISLVLTIRSYCRNYTDMKPVVFLCYGLKASLRTEHSMLKLKMLNQTNQLSNVVYLRVLLWFHFCFGHT